MAAMFGWLSDARTSASRWKRLTRSASRENSSGRILIATPRFSFKSRARYTSPIPPLPSKAVISYEPSCCPIAIAIEWADYSQTITNSEMIQVVSKMIENNHLALTCPTFNPRQTLAHQKKTPRVASRRKVGWWRKSSADRFYRHCPKYTVSRKGQEIGGRRI